MLARAIYSICNAIIHRDELYRVAFYESIECVTDMNDFVLSRKQIMVLALDFDGVLAPRGYHEPVFAVKQWLDSVINKGRFKRIYIYSNGPTESRKRYFEIHYPEVKFLSKVRKKPYPDGLYEIAELEGIPTAEIAIVDDRLLTGILAAIIAGSSSIFIRKPLIDYSKNTVAELFFTTLRFIERQIIFHY
jgi:uncharacterized protein